MRPPKFFGIDLDKPLHVGRVIDNVEQWLAQKYIGLLLELPGGQLHPDGVECSGPGYQRQFFEPRSRTQRIEFPAATGNWGTIVGFGVYDKFKEGELLLFCPTTAPMPISRGENTYVDFKLIVAAVSGDAAQLHKTSEPNFLPR